MFQNCIPRTITVQLDEFWLPLSNGWIEDVDHYLKKAGYNNAAPALRDLRADVIECAKELRIAHEIEAAILLEKLAADMRELLRSL